MTKEKSRTGQVRARRLTFAVPPSDVTTNDFVEAQANLSESLRHLVRDYVRRNGIDDPAQGRVATGAGGRPTDAELRRRARAVRTALAAVGADEATIAAALLDARLDAHDDDAGSQPQEQPAAGAAAPAEGGDLDLDGPDDAPEATGILVGGDASAVLAEEPAAGPAKQQRRPRDPFDAMMGEGEEEEYDPSKSM